jgi:hypothetical protein
MAEAALDSRKWSQYIFNSRVLLEFLKDKNFVSEQIKYVTGLYSNKAVSPLDIVGTLVMTLEANDKVIKAVERIPGCNDTTNRKIILHWYAILVCISAREFGLIRFGQTQNGGQQNE